MGGEIAAGTMTRKKKKKGRPSLLELQKRSLKQQQQQQQQSLQQENPNLINPNSSFNSNRRSTRRIPNLEGGSPVPDWVAGGDDDDDERQQKKHKLLLGLNSSRNHQHYLIPSAPNSASYGSDSNADGEDLEASLKRRKIATLRPGSDQMGEKVLKATDTLPGSPVESGPTTPLPDKKLLVFILDRLQKKDTYGVFSEPVDPEELPDYHDIIAYPMDFLTVRKKLDGGAYTTLEQFEKDVFLICSNAMQYNAPDTIYFRQARSMQELAKKDFENLRQDSDEGEPQPKVVRRGRPPGKSLKKALESLSFDCVGSEFSSDATLATGPDASGLSNTYNLRKGPNSHKLRPADTLIRSCWGSHSNENYVSWSSEWENEFPASVVKAVMKYGKKHFAVDENKRDTYNHSLASVHEQPISSTLDGGLKQLIPVGLSTENGYAASLARFAADLGPVAWKFASRKIGSVLPSGLKFGPGWVGENRMIEQQQFSFSEKQKSSSSLSDNHSSRLLSPATSGSNSVAASRFPLQGREDTETVRGLSSQNDLTSAPSHQFQQRPLLHSGINGSIGGFGIGYSPQTGLVTQPVNSLFEKTSVPSQTQGMVSGSSSTMCPMSASDFLPKETKFADSSIALHSGNAMSIGPDPGSHVATNVGLQRKSYNIKDFPPFPPDLNVSSLAPGSPSSSVPIGSPQYPDLALQL
ncbi:bromodomain-containing protein 9-like [Durio zibethinus]|uniref:Bromodomain-containing protein 9-like n=1 Tax=Durio zibethinus TaxID=66656 RepID=A0A6P6AWY0_DURZI|nr:bromodomain-containing protein 9-like [Durio zibethinus]